MEDKKLQKLFPNKPKDQGDARGFKALDVELKEKGSKQLKERRNEFLKDHNAKKQISFSKKSPNLFLISNSEINIPLKERIEVLNDLAIAKELTLVATLPSAASSMNEQLELLLSSLEGVKTINLYNQKRFKSFYMIRNRFDHNHLNENGARIFTNKLAEEHNKLIDCNN